MDITQIAHVEISEDIPDFKYGGINLAGVYPVEHVYPKTGQISYSQEVKLTDKQITRSLKLKPNDIDVDNLPITFHTKHHSV